MTDEFGAAYAKVLAHDVVLSEIGGLTAEQGIAAGVSTKSIWLAICDVQDVPESRRYGVGIREPKKS
jgi:Protein of unknown function (DUF3046)